LTQRRRGGWWGVAFVVLLFVSAAIASLPTSADSDTAITAFYRDHGAVIAIQQVLGAVALVPFVLFALSLKPNRWLRPAAYLLVGIELVTNVIPLVVLVAPGTARPLTFAEDVADAALFLAVALFAAAATLREPLWLRLVAYLVAVLCVIRALASPLHVDFLDQVAPLAFVAFVLLLSIRAIVRPSGVLVASGDSDPGPGGV
jgi:hypothetical protein